MSGPVNRSTFERLIAEDIEWLERQPDTLERRHILAILRESPRYIYEAHPVAIIVTDFENATPA